MWSYSGSTSIARSVSGSLVPSSDSRRIRRGSNCVARKISHVPSEAASADARMPTFASSSVAPSKASVAISSARVKPMPATVPAPATAAQPTGGLKRPRVARARAHETPKIPSGLPTT